MGNKDNVSMPKYMLVMNSLSERIEKGEFARGHMLPPESDLIEEYNVSRITIRKALDELEAQDIIYRKQGKGTFVNEIFEEDESYKKYNEGLGAIITKSGKVCDRIQMQKVIRPVGAFGELLGLDPEDPCLFYQRVYTADGIPVFLVESTINHTAFQGIENYDFNFLSLSVVIKQVFDAKLYRRNRQVHSTKAGRAAEPLCIGEDDPILYLTYTSYLKVDNDMVPFDQTELFARTDIVTMNPDYI